MKVSAFNFAVSSISSVRMVGGKQLQGVLGIENLPKSLHPLLRQPVISTQDLAPFEKLRKRAQEFLRGVGAWHELLGWITADTSIDREAIVAFMEETSREFYEEKVALLARYGQRCAEHLEKIRKECEESQFQHCDLLIDLIRQAQPTTKYLEDHIQFTFLRPRIVEIHEDEEEKVLSGLYGQALNEIQARARRAVDAPRIKTQRKAAGEIAEKCESLGYLDPRYRLVKSEIDGVLSGIPADRKDAEYSAVERLSLTGMLSILSDASALDDRIKSGGGLFPLVEPVEEHETPGDEQPGNIEFKLETALVPDADVAVQGNSSEAESRVYSW